MILYLWDSQEAKPAYRYGSYGSQQAGHGGLDEAAGDCSGKVVEVWHSRQGLLALGKVLFGGRQEGPGVVRERSTDQQSFWHEVCYYRTQNAEVLYRDYGKKMPVEELEEEDCDGLGPHLSSRVS